MYTTQTVRPIRTIFGRFSTILGVNIPIYLRIAVIVLVMVRVGLRVLVMVQGGIPPYGVKETLVVNGNTTIT